MTQPIEMKSLAAFSIKEGKSTVAEKKDKVKYSSAKQQSKLMLRAKSSQRAFWKLKKRETLIRAAA